MTFQSSRTSWNKGKKHTEETKKKISKALSGIKRSKETIKKMSDRMKGSKHSDEIRRKISLAKKGKSNGWLGRKHSEKSKKKMSNRMKGSKFSDETKLKMSLAHRGNKSYRWKGGITKENNKIRNNIEYRLWREAVFARDNWTCQKCRAKNISLQSHHIQNFAQYPELRFAIDNGITMCKECHKKFHKKYGIKNNILEQVLEFI